MTEPGPDRPLPGGKERAFVRRLADAYAPPGLSPAERVAFHARLDERIARRRRARRWRMGLAGSAVVATLALFVFGRPRTEVTPEGAGDMRVTALASRTLVEDPTTAETAILALVADAPDGQDDAFPEDYLAIEDLLLGG
jgi:hypothetical protein